MMFDLAAIVNQVRAQARAEVVEEIASALNARKVMFDYANWVRQFKIKGAKIERNPNPIKAYSINGIVVANSKED